MSTAYQRARSPRQKAERAEQILAAAEEMLAGGQDSTGLSLSELARRAGMAKSNVYRYFESREAVLLALLEDRTEHWAEATIEALGRMHRDPGSGSRSARRRIDEVAEILASLAADRPVMCHLMSVLPSVLEHNASVESVRGYKEANLALIGRLAEAMHTVVPELPIERHGELLHHAFAFIVGGWPLAHPSTVAEEVMRAPALAALRRLFDDDLRRVLGLMAAGMLADEG